MFRCDTDVPIIKQLSAEQVARKRRMVRGFVVRKRRSLEANLLSVMRLHYISHYKNMCYNINVGLLRQPACLVVSPITVDNFLFNCTPAVGPQTLIDVASDVGVNFKNVGVLSIESSLFHLFHYTFLQTEHQRKGY